MSHCLLVKNLLHQLQERLGSKRHMQQPRQAYHNAHYLHHQPFPTLADFLKFLGFCSIFSLIRTLCKKLDYLNSQKRTVLHRIASWPTSTLILGGAYREAKIKVHSVVHQILCGQYSTAILSHASPPQEALDCDLHHAAGSPAQARAQASRQYVSLGGLWSPCPPSPSTTRPFPWSLFIFSQGFSREASEHPGYSPPPQL